MPIHDLAHGGARPHGDRTSPFSMGPGSCGWPMPFADARVENGRCPRKLACHWIGNRTSPFRWWRPGAPPNIAHFILGGAGLGVSGRCSGRGRRGVARPLPTAPLWMKGIGTMDKAWTTPPTVVPRADVGRDAPSRRRGATLPHGSENIARFKGRVCRTGFNRTSPFSCTAGLPARVLRRFDPVGRGVPPAQVEKGDVLFHWKTQGRGRRSAEILLTYTVVRSSLFSECRTT